MANPGLQAGAAFSQLSATVLEAGGSLGSYKATALARSIQRDRATTLARQRDKTSSRAFHKLPWTFGQLEENKETNDGKPLLV